MINTLLKKFNLFLLVAFIFGSVFIVAFNYSFITDIKLFLASLLGYLGISFLILQLSIGNKIFVKYFTSDILKINHLHQNLGKYGSLLIILHPLLLVNYYQFDLSWIFSLSFSSEWNTHVTVGRIALLILVFIIISSVFFRKIIQYKFWKKTHYLSYLLIILVLLHPRDIGFYYGKFFEIYWGILSLFVIALLLYRFMSAIGIFSDFGELIFIEKFYDVTHIKLRLNQGFNILPNPGQFVYLSLNRFGEPHPFSIVSYDQTNKIIEFGIKSIGEFTSKISQLNLGKKIYVDGPYGVLFDNENINLPQVYIAGGIGITPFYNKIINGEKHASRVLLYCNRKLESIVFRDRFKNIDNLNYYDFLSDEHKISDEKMICGHLDKAELEKILSNKLVQAQYYICGSKGFNKGIFKELISLNVKPNQIFIENFG